MQFDIVNATGQSIKTKLGQLFITKYLGRGKSGYSYMANNGKNQYTLKLMHYEPCSCYSFGDSNKVQLEIDAYARLSKLLIKMPKLFDFDIKKNYLVKEFIDGIVAPQLISQGKAGIVIEQLYNMAQKTQKAGLNLDFYPANFVVKEQELFYIDYEFNPYTEDWNLENWGIYYWANTNGMKKYIETGDICYLNQSDGSGIPIKNGFEILINSWTKQYTEQ